MKALLVLLALFALPISANNYGGIRLSELLPQTVQDQKVLAEAESLADLQQQLQKKINNDDINTLLQGAPSAAGEPTANIEVHTNRVKQVCYYSFQALACNSKVIYQAVEASR